METSVFWPDREAVFERIALLREGLEYCAQPRMAPVEGDAQKTARAQDVLDRDDYGWDRPWPPQR